MIRSCVNTPVRLTSVSGRQSRVDSNTFADAVQHKTQSDTSIAIRRRSPHTFLLMLGDRAPLSYVQPAVHTHYWRFTSSLAAGAADHTHTHTTLRLDFILDSLWKVTRSHECQFNCFSLRTEEKQLMCSHMTSNNSFVTLLLSRIWPFFRFSFC